MNKKEINIVYKDIEELIPYVNNPRDNSGAVDAVASSIKNFGFKVPIVVDRGNEIVTGHTRLLAAKKLGMKKVPVIVADDLTQNEVKAFRLADNKVGELAQWDLEALENELGGVEGIDMTQFGFDELEELAEEIVEDVEDVSIPEDCKVSKGQIWILGDHRLMCGDSTKPEDVDKLIQGQEIDLCVTDPPYNVNYENSAGKIENDNLSDDDFKEFAYLACKQIERVLKPGGVYYLWHADAKSAPWHNALTELDIPARQVLIWVKSQATLSRQDYNWKHEPCLYGWKEGAGHYYCQDFTETTVIENKPNINQLDYDDLRDYAKSLEDFIDSGSTIIREDKPERSELHPTMKPVKLMAKSILNSSRKGERVLDLFGGSGSTLIACEQTGRKAYLMEFEPIYADAIINRWEEFTGNKAILEEEI